MNHSLLQRIRLGIVACSLAACSSTAGPFITDIKPVGPGRLHVEKCKVEFDRSDNTVSTKECTYEYINFTCADNQCAGRTAPVRTTPPQSPTPTPQAQ
jgi:hypothetical protein